MAAAEPKKAHAVRFRRADDEAERSTGWKPGGKDSAACTALLERLQSQGCVIVGIDEISDVEWAF